MRAHEFVSGFFLGGDSENHDILTEDGKQFQFIHPCLHLGGDTLPQGIKPLIPVLFLAYFLEPASPKKIFAPFGLLRATDMEGNYCLHRLVLSWFKDFKMQYGFCEMHLIQICFYYLEN